MLWISEMVATVTVILVELVVVVDVHEYKCMQETHKLKFIETPTTTTTTTLPHPCQNRLFFLPLDDVVRVVLDNHLW
jgi:hypothetical protein